MLECGGGEKRCGERCDWRDGGEKGSVLGVRGSEKRCWGMKKWWGDVGRGVGSVLGCGGW